MADRARVVEPDLWRLDTVRIMRNEESAVIAMGKLGGYEMTATSDLDLILVYDFDHVSPGKRDRRYRDRLPG